MSRSTLEAIAERWVPGAGPVELQPLISGLVNESCRVARGGNVYSLRVAAADAVDLGLDRGWECRVLRQAAAAGLAPPIEECLPQKGILVVRWVSGRSWTPGEAREAGNVDAMAELLRRIHALSIPQPARVMSAGAWISHYTQAAARRDFALSRRATELRGDAETCLQALKVFGTPEPVLCHSDLHRMNVVIGDHEGAQPVLLDWEYAHVSDGFWDLAGWMANNDWTQDASRPFLASYLGRPPDRAESTRLNLLTWLYDYVCLLWGEIYLNQRPGSEGSAVSDRAERLATRLGLQQVRWPRRTRSGTLDG